jgi:anti-sigma regulatory factor (Ser/Thr protein kinase)
MSVDLLEAPRAIDPVVAFFPAEPESVRKVRKLVRETLTAWGLSALVGDVELAASELATNAVKYCDVDEAMIRLDIFCCREALTLGVSDPGRRSLRRAEGGELLDESGRGLLIVRQLAEEVGVQRGPFVKRVWARFPLGGDGGEGA